jgi:hypothetical protein
MDHEAHRSTQEGVKNINKTLEYQNNRINTTSRTKNIDILISYHVYTPIMHKADTHAITKIISQKQALPRKSENPYFPDRKKRDTQYPSAFPDEGQIIIRT